MAKRSLEAELDRLESLDLEGLRHVWRKRMRTEPPNVRAFSDQSASYPQELK
jgi:hypothetical protein